MTYYRTLTPEFRSQINKSIKNQETELATCQNTAFVNFERVGLRLLSNLINALPDGFPIPLERRDNYDGE